MVGLRAGLIWSKSLSTRLSIRSPAGGPFNDFGNHQGAFGPPGGRPGHLALWVVVGNAATLHGRPSDSYKNGGLTLIARKAHIAGEGR